MFDHVSVSWGRDETFSINGDVSNVTISDSIIAQGLETHSCGGLIQTDGGVSIIRTLYIDNQTRNPKVKGVNEFVNNVVCGQLFIYCFNYVDSPSPHGTIGLQLGRRWWLHCRRLCWAFLCKHPKQYLHQVCTK